MQAIRDGEHRLARNREKITVCENQRWSHQRQHMVDLEAEASRYRLQLVALTGRARDVRLRIEETSTALTAAQQEHERVSRDLAEHEAAVAEWSEQLGTWRQLIDEKRVQYVANVRRAAQLSNEITLQHTRRKNAESRLVQNERKLARLIEERLDYQRQLEDARLAEGQVGTELERTAAELELATRTLDENQSLAHAPPRRTLVAARQTERDLRARGFIG